MKKSLIALAALASVAGVAQAQSSVEVYGVLDMSYGQAESKKDGLATAKVNNVGATNANGGSTSGNGAGDFYGSRLGFRGTEDLGSGTKAGFVYEIGLNLTGASGANTSQSQSTGYGAANTTATTTYVPGSTTTATTTAQTYNVRQAFVSLGNTSYGEVRLGTVYNPVDATGGSLAALSANGGTNHVMGATNLLKLGQGDTARFSNAVMYTSPTYNGLTFRFVDNVSKSTDVSGAVKNGEGYAYGLDYAAGKFKGGIATSTLKNVYNASANGTVAKLINFLGDNDSNLGYATTKSDIRYTVGGGMYDFGFATIGYQHAEYKNTPTSGTGAIKHKVDLVAATIPLVGAFSLKPAYAVGHVDADGVKAYNTSGIDLGLFYAASKRTDLYVTYNEQKAEGKSGNTADNGLTIKTDSVAVGVVHRF